VFEYGKTENLFKRDPDTHKLTYEKRLPEFDLVHEFSWIATEKIDGTNVRIIIENGDLGDDPFRTELRGRTNKANLPTGLYVYPDQDGLLNLYRDWDMPKDTILTFYGEAFGAGIQKGGSYSSSKHIRVFDLVTSRRRFSEEMDDLGLDHRWAHYGAFCEAAQYAGLSVAPRVFPGFTLAEMIERVRHGFRSPTAQLHGAGGDAEGIVCRTDPYIFDSRGNRIMFKLKTKDLA